MSLSDDRVPGGSVGKRVNLGGTTTSSGESAGLVVAEQVALQPGDDEDNDVKVVDIGQYGYETIAVSQTGQILGTTGATGDFLHRLIIEVITVATASVTLLDDTGSMVVLTGGANLLEGVYSIEFNMTSLNGAWSVTTGAGATVIAVGRFN